MMHYKKGKNVEEELVKESIPIENLPENFLWMHVKGGTKVSNVLEFAKKAFANGEYRAVVWSGSGGGVGKTITCAEIMKKDLVLHQVTRLCYRKAEEFWDADQDGLEQIVATRKIPCIHILQSLDEIDPKTSGYQYSKKQSSFWIEPKVKQSNRDYLAGCKKNKFNKKGGGRDKGSSGGAGKDHVSGSGNNSRNTNAKSNKRPNTNS